MKTYRITWTETFSVNLKASSEEEAWEAFNDRALDDADGPRKLVSWGDDKSIEALENWQLGEGDNA